MIPSDSPILMFGRQMLSVYSSDLETAADAQGIHRVLVEPIVRLDVRQPIPGLRFPGHLTRRERDLHAEAASNPVDAAPVVRGTILDRAVLVAGEVELIDPRLVRDEELQTEEGAKPELVRPALVVRAGADEPAPDLEPVVGPVGHPWPTTEYVV